ncbi:MAG: TetR/AcrR family transcriptional regulator [Clostridium sp.]|nr:TetR/AcrR family transcriptional regulator [Clostridium sp.]MCM1172931.1 TetR/AcrR family transcriptional regulator [Clostridium sp.]MCM1209517.1 TetR/AcrR family transcriptional regulator [Ruminococcus sp.]
MNNEKINMLVKDYITDALIKLLNKKTLDKISITEIVNVAGVGRVSFYRNFESKEDIIDKYLTKITDEFIDVSGINFKTNDTKTYISILFKHLEKYKDFAYNLYKSNNLHLIEKQFRRIFEMRNYDYNEYKRQFYIGGIYNIYQYWLINGCKETPEEMANNLVDLLQK